MAAHRFLTIVKYYGERICEESVSGAKHGVLCMSTRGQKGKDVSWQITEGDGPLVTTAIHAGHGLRPDVLEHMALDESTRLREEDPFTDRLTDLGPGRIVVETSRFEVDMNRPREKAVYLSRADAWGLDVWKGRLPKSVRRESLKKYNRFYEEVGGFLDGVHEARGKFVVLDLHSYCHRRGGPGAPPDDPRMNPDIDIGTGSVHKDRWSPLIARLKGELRDFDFKGERLDVRENVKFAGGHFSRWSNKRYGGNGCVIAIEFKKTFMDEWTGVLDVARLELLKKALESTLPGIIEELAIRGRDRVFPRGTGCRS